MKKVLILMLCFALVASVASAQIRLETELSNHAIPALNGIGGVSPTVVGAIIPNATVKVGYAISPAIVISGIFGMQSSSYEDDSGNNPEATASGSQIGLGVDYILPMGGNVDVEVGGSYCAISGTIDGENDVGDTADAAIGGSILELSVKAVGKINDGIGLFVKAAYESVQATLDNELPATEAKSEESASGIKTAIGVIVNI
ncbi:hypothetical protein ACFL56_01965 [Candidatus Margulisiibacteriota bacterium]